MHCLQFHKLNSVSLLSAIAAVSGKHSITSNKNKYNCRFTDILKCRPEGAIRAPSPASFILCAITFYPVAPMLRSITYVCLKYIYLKKGWIWRYQEMENQPLWLVAYLNLFIHTQCWQCLLYFQVDFSQPQLPAIDRKIRRNSVKQKILVTINILKYIFLSSTFIRHM